MNLVEPSSPQPSPPQVCGGEGEEARGGSGARGALSDRGFSARRGAHGVCALPARTDAFQFKTGIRKGRASKPIGRSVPGARMGKFFFQIFHLHSSMIAL